MRALPIHVRTLASAGPNANGKKVPAVDPMVGTRSTWSYYLAPWSSSQALLDWTAKQLQQGVSRIQRRPLFGTQCRPVGGPAGFEPHRHRTAPCSYTGLRLPGKRSRPGHVRRRKFAIRQSVCTRQPVCRGLIQHRHDACPSESDSPKQNHRTRRVTQRCLFLKDNLNDLIILFQSNTVLLFQ